MDFTADLVPMLTSSPLPVCFSTLKSYKRDMVVDALEFHNYTGEGMLCPDDDVVIHVAPATNRTLALHKTRAFYIPKGTLVMLKVAVWHYAAFPVHKNKANVIIILAGTAPMPTTAKLYSSRRRKNPHCIVISFTAIEQEDFSYVH